MTGHVQPTDLLGYLQRTLPAGQHTKTRAHLDGCEQCWSQWNRFRWDQARPTRLYGELLEFLGRDFRPYFDSSRELAREWDAANPRTDSEVRDFFRTSMSYLYNLVISEASGHRPDYIAAGLPILHCAQARTIVDYGCGIGSDSLVLRDSGLTVIPCDYHSPSTTFMRWRAARTGTPLDVIEPHELFATPDAVWIIDTLDHLTDIDQQLGPLLHSARLVICENLAINRAHGRQRFHHRRTSEQIKHIFSRYGFVPSSQAHDAGNDCPITTLEMRSQ